MLVQLSEVSKAFGSRAVLRNVSLQINPSEKIGLIGTNGSGKTTLLKMLSARMEIDEGSISRKAGLQVGTLDQIPDFHEDTTVLEEGLRSFADLIATDKVIGWFQGRMEFGPRALGGRSIIGDARSAKMQETMNLKIKFRESFRPFALSVLRDRASEWFDLEE